MDYPLLRRLQALLELYKKPVTAYTMYDEWFAGLLGECGVQSEYLALIFGRASAFFVETGFADCCNARVSCESSQSFYCFGSYRLRSAPGMYANAVSCGAVLAPKLFVGLYRCDYIGPGASVSVYVGEIFQFWFHGTGS